MSRASVVNSHEIIAGVWRTGTIWTLAPAGDLNVNLLCFPMGEGVDEHVNDEVDVVFVGVSGSGVIEVDGEEHPLLPGTIAFVPKGASRSIRSTSEELVHLSVHRRRGPLQIGRR